MVNLAVPGSPAVTFVPAPLRGTSFRVDIGTAESVTLLLQTLLPAMLLAGGGIRLRSPAGGTHVAWSPPLDDLRLVLLDHLAARSRRLGVEVRSGGFYPKGEGEVVVEAEGPMAGPLFRRSERGPLQELRIASFASEELASLRVAERPELSLRRSPRERRWTNTRPTSLIPWLAVCGGSRRASRLSEDARTNLWIAEQFTGPLFSVEGTAIHCAEPFRAPSRP